MSGPSVRSWLQGPLVAVPTPFHDDFSLDLDGLRSNVEAMVARGVRTGDGVLLVAGAAGEFPAMSREERVAVMATAVDAAGGLVPVMSSVQHTDWREVTSLAREAEDAGIAGLQVGCTYYYPSTQDDFLRLVESVGQATRLPLMIYSTWWEGGLTFDAASLLRLAELPGVAAVKWSAPTYERFTEGVAAVADRLVVIDNQARHVWGHILGARGFVTHISNFWPEYPHAIWRALDAGDYTSVPELLRRFKWDWTRWAGEVASTSGGEGPFIKGAMRELGFAAGPPRPPSVEPTASQIARLRELLARAEVPRNPTAVAA
jgi:dihydrodipicolinate synthase/N-acetylneuraminate lyase